MEAEGLSPFS